MTFFAKHLGSFGIKSYHRHPFQKFIQHPFLCLGVAGAIHAIVKFGQSDN